MKKCLSKFQKVCFQRQEFPQLTASPVDFLLFWFFVKSWPQFLPFWQKYKVAELRSGGGSKLLQVLSSCFWIVSTIWFVLVAEIPLSSGRNCQLWNVGLDKSRSGMRSFCFFAKTSFKVDESFLDNKLLLHSSADTRRMSSSDCSKNLKWNFSSDYHSAADWACSLMSDLGSEKITGR